MNNTETPVKVKRGPGRPCSQPKQEKIQRNGIVEKPSFEENVVELIYDMPLYFKKIFNLFKLMAVREIKIEFTSTLIRIITTDHLEKNFNELKINGSKLTQYYCKFPITVIIDPKNIEKVLQKIDRNYNTITILLKQISYRNAITIIFDDKKMNFKEHHIINLMESNLNDNGYLFRDIKYELYPVQFKLPSKYFKKMINDILLFSNTFTIEIFNSRLLQFPYDTQAKTIKAANISQNPETIKLKSTISKDDIFSVSMNIDCIKSLSNSLISDSIQFYVDKEKDTVFKLLIDNGTFELLIFTKIIKYN